MSYAQLRIEYEKVKFLGPPVAYLVRTSIDAINTEPDEIDTSLVVKKGDASSNEYLARVATAGEVITSPLPALPVDIDHFASVDFSMVSLQVGDVITILEPPAIWQYFFGETGEIEVTVTDVTDPLNVIVDPPLPAFGRNLKFKVIRGGSTWILPAAFGDDYPENGVANRDYSAFLPGELYFLVGEHHDSWDNLTDANNAVEARRTEAQSLVNTLNEDAFSGVLEETYE